MSAAVLIGPALGATDPGLNQDSVSRPEFTAPPEFTAEPVFVNFGLLGRWAAACDQRASPVNPHVSVSAPGAGLIVESHDVGPDFTPNLYHVVAARRVDKDTIEARVLFRPGTESEEAQTIQMRVARDKKGIGTRRTMFNRDEDGEVRVKNGIVVRSGGKTAVLRRCS